MSRMERARRSQARFVRHLKLTINVFCILAIVVVLFYIFFLAPEAEVKEVGAPPAAEAEGSAAE